MFAKNFVSMRSKNHMEITILIGSFHMFEWVSEVTQLCLTFCNPKDCSLPGFSVHGMIFQAGVLEWVAIPFIHIFTVSQVSLFLTWFNTVAFEGTWVTFWVLDLLCGLVQKQLLLSKERYSLFCGLFFDIYVWTSIRVMLIRSGPGPRQIPSLCRSHFTELFSASMTIHPLVSSR